MGLIYLSDSSVLGLQQPHISRTERVALTPAYPISKIQGLHKVVEWYPTPAPPQSIREGRKCKIHVHQRGRFQQKSHLHRLGSCYLAGIPHGATVD